MSWLPEQSSNVQFVWNEGKVYAIQSLYFTGVLQRNTGLSWLRNNLNPDYHSGVVYFADDDNTYSIELFKEVSE